MIKVFKQIPAPLQRQILYRLGYGIAILLVTIILLFYTMELFSILACAIIMIFFIASAFLLFRRAVIGDYVVICGECINVTVTAVKKRTKMVVLHTEDGRILKVTLKHRLKKINTGSKIILYVASDMPVYENGGVHLIYSYISLVNNK